MLGQGDPPGAPAEPAPIADIPQLPTSPSSAPTMWGVCGWGTPCGVSCCAGGTGLQIGEETRLWEVKRERWPQEFGKFSVNCIYWARITQARAGMLVQDC